MEIHTLTIADLIVHRSYRSALSMDKVLAVIENHSGSLYDPDVVNACQRLINEKGYKTED
ncbi:MAG: hypothetical protein D4R93_06930 [Deltaproteobacteria bacterium]|nr:MAG: hypothetical protein D4R93_06930 [Deltaproteobacteria bacterium]